VSPFAPSFLSRLRVVGLKYEDARVEHILAFARLAVALTSLGAWLIHLGDTSPHYRAGLILLCGYAAASAVLLVVLWIRGESSRGFVVAAQVNDLGWPALLCLFAEVPNSTFFMLFFFATLMAAFRWGFVETAATALVGAAFLLLQAVLLRYGSPPVRNLIFTPVEPSRLLMRSVGLIMGGCLFGFLAETEKQLRAEIALTGRLLSMTTVGSRFPFVLQSVFFELGQVFRGKTVYGIAAQQSTGRTFKWEIPSLSDPAIRLTEISPADKASELMASYPYTFFMRRVGSNGRCAITALDEEGGRLDADQTKGLEMPVARAGSILVVSHEMGHDWHGRLVMVNARLGQQREHELRFAQSITRQVAPALYSVYLFRRFRARAGATERVRVARELHDTTIQSLISIEMQLDVLRRRSSDSQVTAELGRIQELMRHEVLNLRELMQTMRPVDIGPHQFLDFIAELVERFSRDTGIAVRFISELQEVTLPAAVCRELARVVQEGLANIRKHSGAHAAIVRFGPQAGLWKLVISDDGTGFPFAGRFSLKELDSLRRGPAIIKERVRAVGGDMVIESTPGQGSRLEVTIPQKGHETYG
jgi:signal transduction histidine kinase